MRSSKMIYYRAQHKMVLAHRPIARYNNVYQTNLILSLSPLTISSSLLKSSGISQVALIYLPANHSRLLEVRETRTSAESSGASIKTAKNQ